MASDAKCVHLYFNQVDMLHFFSFPTQLTSDDKPPEILENKFKFSTMEE